MTFYAKTPEYRVVHRNLSDMTQVTTGMPSQKGSWTLHMLRQLMGDNRFWAGIRDYYARHQNTSASTNALRLAMERASGRDLSAFFQQWLYRGGVPTVEGTWQWDGNAKQIVVILAQTQLGEPFLLPVEIGISTPGGACACGARGTLGAVGPIHLDGGTRTHGGGTGSQRAVAHGRLTKR